MPEPTLLIWDDDATLSFDPGIDDLRDRLIREGVLVPVEPDYEAAENVGADEVFGPDGSFGADAAWGDGSGRKVVDAALGIGDNDA